MFIEIVAQDLKDVLFLNKSSVPDQIELCDGLEAGAYTPQFKVIQECSEISRIPIRILLKPNVTNYISDEEYESLKEIIIKIKTTKTFGIVFGWITKNNEIEYDKIAKLCEIAKPLKMSFYRCFDEIEENKIEAAKKLRNLGFDTILTTGGLSGNAIDNYQSILDISNSVKNIRMLCGKGVDQKSSKLLTKLDLSSLHVGTAVRKNKSWKNSISYDLLNDLI